MEILIEAKDRGLDLRVNTDCRFTMNCPLPRGGPKDSPKDLGADSNIISPPCGFTGK